MEERNRERKEDKDELGKEKHWGWENKGGKRKKETGEKQGSEGTGK